MRPNHHRRIVIHTGEAADEINISKKGGTPAACEEARHAIPGSVSETMLERSEGKVLHVVGEDEGQGRAPATIMPRIFSRASATSSYNLSAAIESAEHAIA
ncbi:hypothetical protein MTO96_007074 [Rhipicephalus appendiculatus]